MDPNLGWPRICTIADVRSHHGGDRSPPFAQKRWARGVQRRSRSVSLRCSVRACRVEGKRGSSKHGFEGFYVTCRVEGEPGGKASDQVGGSQKAERWRAFSSKNQGSTYTWCRNIKSGVCVTVGVQVHLLWPPLQLASQRGSPRFEKSKILESYASE
jgi:hypothetical protein